MGGFHEGSRPPTGSEIKRYTCPPTPPQTRISCKFSQVKLCHSPGAGFVLQTLEHVLCELNIGGRSSNESPTAGEAVNQMLGARLPGPCPCYWRKSPRFLAGQWNDIIPQGEQQSWPPGSRAASRWTAVMGELMIQVTKGTPCCDRRSEIPVICSPRRGDGWMFGFPMGCAQGILARPPSGKC